jgi:hypothetical protein
MQRTNCQLPAPTIPACPYVTRFVRFQNAPFDFENYGEQPMRQATCFFLLIAPLVASMIQLTAVRNARSDEPTASSSEPAGSDESTAPTEAKEGDESEPKDPPGLVRLHPKDPIWIEPKRKLVIVDGTVCLDEGQLEMFACPVGTKEHEAVIAVKTKAQLVHAGLLAVGAKAGSPVRFDPIYKPAHGTEVEVRVLWTDKDGKKHNVPAQEMVRSVETGKPMQSNWVFGGSGFYVDEATGEKYYLAEDGDMICVSNFGTAMLDVPIQSSQATGGLLFEAFTENIPPVDTKVRLVLIPKVERPKEKTKGGAKEEPKDGVRKDD